jgi:GT2 family glycosyltransferase
MKFCSIIICHYSKIDDFGATSARNPIDRFLLVKNLIESLEKNTDYPCEIIVWDNGDKDEQYFLDKVKQGTINYYIRAKTNQHFAHAWNQAAKLATGDYLCFVCNDVEALPGWLSSCVKILEDYPDKKWVATPFITYDKRKHTVEITKEGYRVNMRSGSNFMVMRKKDWSELGEFPRHRIGGSLWYTKNFRAGWWFVAPEKDLAIDRGWRNGVNFSIPIKVINKLLNGEEIHLEEPIQ